MTSPLIQDRMPEAEVSLRLAFHLLTLPGSDGAAQVAIDGAQVRVHGSEVFSIETFVDDQGWKQVESTAKHKWQGEYWKDKLHLTVHSRPGEGDVVAQVSDKCIRAECKGGPLTHKPGNPEYRILRGALGTLMTLDEIGVQDILVVAVPDTPAFRSLADKWRTAPLVARSQVQIVLVGRDGSVQGLSLS